ncbi:MAG: M1 family aminopeptidase [Bryobacteraceae bacterium]
MIRCAPAALCLFGTALFAALPAPPDFRLPGNVAPVRYRIELRINPAQEIFDGQARIEVELRNSVSVIWLNAKDLTVGEASMKMRGKTRTLRAEAVAGEFLGLELDAPAGPGRAVLAIRYQGRLNEKPPVGPFRKKAGDDWFVFTTFTAIDARRAFPCFDEPRFKTPWDLTIRVKSGQKAFANAPAVREVDEPDGMKAVHFATTEPLPSEVVAFAVGPFDLLDGRPAGKRAIPVRVITPPNRREEGAEALRATGDVLRRLEAYTGIPYPYAKLDHIAMPEGAFGATENPGLITFRQTSLLIAPGKETEERVLRLRALVTHELAHQWFGNLVTQSSWDDVWLSEGFATWLSARVMDESQPAGRRRLSAVVARERIMEADAGKQALAVRRPLKNREEMASVYNRFVYQKGAAVLLMLEAWLGDERFRDGARVYLKRHRFGAATTADFASALQAASGTDASPVLRSFLDQTGIPNVRMRKVCEPGASPRLQIEQTSVGRQWTIPVCWKADGSLRACVVLEGQRREIDLGRRAACPAWIFPNTAGAGYYRTAWDAGSLAALADRGIRQLTASERLTLVYDLKALRRAGRLEAESERVLARLAEDVEPEIARAVQEALGKAQPATGR